MIRNKIELKKINFINFNHFCYYLFVGLLVACKAFGFSTTGSFSNSIPYIACAVIGTLLLAYKMAFECYTKRELAISMSILCVALLTFVFSREYGFLFFALAITGGKSVNSFKVLKFASKIWVVCYIINMFLALFKIRPNNPIPLYGSFGLTGYAYSYGYGHKNQFSIATFTTFLSYMYIRKDKKNFIDVSVAFAILFYFMTTCKSDTGLIILSLAYLMYIMLKIKIINNKNIKLLRIVLPICVIGTFLFTILYKFGYGTFFNKLFSSRLELQNLYLNNFPISIFGHDLRHFNYAIDNGYCALYFQYGIFALIIFCVLYHKLIERLWESDKKHEMIMISCFLISGLMEGYFVNPFMNTSILLLSLVIYPNNKFIN